ncbi:MAG: biosynthetic arginine decarboxylase [Phycisphaerales bacterium JB059]
MTTTHRTPGEEMLSGRWTPGMSEALYRVEAWGGGFFGINDAGRVVARCAGTDVELEEVVEGLLARGLETPVLLRFSDILDQRLKQLREAFDGAIRENEYRGAYRGVYPIKVNQQRHLVEEVCRVGRELGFGLEVGSKPELLAALALTAGIDDQLIVCNGFKDQRYVEMVVHAQRLGRTIVPIVENPRELGRILDTAEGCGVRPSVGIRVKISSSGTGRWRDSAGSRSKFGLTTGELLESVRILRERGMLDCLRLLHCHVGSQVQDIRTIKDTIGELSQVYTELVRLGAPMGMIDVGGGLGVDYRGDQTDAESSMNYSLREFASDVVYRVGDVCTRAGVEHPTIVTECGRAMVAYSSVLVFDVVGSNRQRQRSAGAVDAGGEGEEAPTPIRDLRDALSMVGPGRLVECCHDAKKAIGDAESGFRMGYLTLEQRGEAERLFWEIMRRARDERDRLGLESEELSDLDEILADVYFANLSIFQSLPDAWAIDQVFPVMPIHRLGERPTRRASFGDITCDSDGRLDRFVGESGLQRTLPVHELNDAAYRIGVFLVGAYQETLGDLHNLFGDAHAVHLRVEDGGWTIDEIVRGDTCGEVLAYLQHDGEQMLSSLSRDCDRAVRRGRLSADEAGRVIRDIERELSGYTYLGGNGHA